MRRSGLRISEGTPTIHHSNGSLRALDLIIGDTIYTEYLRGLEQELSVLISSTAQRLRGISTIMHGLALRPLFIVTLQSNNIRESD